MTYFLCPYDVELQEMKRATMLFGIEWIVNHKVRPLLPIASLLFDHLVRVEVVFTIENSTSKNNDSDIYRSNITHFN